MSSGELTIRAGASPGRAAGRRARPLARRLAGRQELVALLALTGLLDLWGLSVNGWANAYYSAAVRSMSTSWHDFLYASMDSSGLMTVDKPPLALWIQALWVRVFGMHPLSVLVPQALMGMGAAALLYDLTRRRFGRAAGFMAGVALATTPIVVAVSRHNNPDELLVLCCVGAAWCSLRALEGGRARWLIASAVCVGLGFETKMLVAMLVVPGSAAAWLWSAPLPLAARVRRLLAAGAAGAAVALAWPLLITLTPTADRPWISGTSDNSIWSLIFGYNGLGRVAGQAGGPAGAVGGGSVFGGATGPLRLLQSGLGDQAGWLLGFALATVVALLALTRLRRRDLRTGWLVVVGGALACSAITFSFARGIFHPYYVSLLAPYTAALVGAGTSLMLPGRHARVPRIFGPLALLAGAVTELVVLGGLSGHLSWARGLLVGVAAIAGVLALVLPPRTRLVLAAVAVAMLMAAPVTWATETLGHATSGTFPAGGPAGTNVPAAGFGGGARVPGLRGRGRASGPLSFAGPPPGTGVPSPLGAGGRGAPSAARGPFGGDSAGLTAAIAYARADGGGTVAVESQSEAAAAILADDARVAGLGGFSGRESAVSLSWLVREVAAGRLRWVLVEGRGSAGLPGDVRAGSAHAFAAAAAACRAIALPTAAGARDTSGATLYDCRGRAGAIAGASSR